MEMKRVHERMTKKRTAEREKRERQKKEQRDKILGRVASSPDVVE